MNKTQNNLDNKAAFFAQYYDQFVMKIPHNNDKLRVFNDWIDKQYNAYLELAPLSQVSEEDAIEVSKIIFKNPQFHTVSKGLRYLRQMVDSGNEYSAYFFSFKKVCGVIDYLRSKSYAVAWRDLSVDDLVAYGWVKLKTELK